MLVPGCFDMAFTAVCRFAVVVPACRCLCSVHANIGIIIIIIVIMCFGRKEKSFIIFKFELPFFFLSLALSRCIRQRTFERIVTDASIYNIFHVLLCVTARFVHRRKHIQIHNRPAFLRRFIFFRIFCTAFDVLQVCSYGNNNKKVYAFTRNAAKKTK